MVMEITAMRRDVLIAFVALVAASAPVAGQEAAGTIGGRATVVDGNTVEIYGRSIRIYGIDTPEGGQPGFGKATDFMRSAAEKGPFICDLVDEDRDERDIAVCRVEVDFISEDIAESLLAEGLAKTFPRNRHLRPSLIAWYEEVEAEAKARCKGLWEELPECRGQ